MIEFDKYTALRTTTSINLRCFGGHQQRSDKNRAYSYSAILSNHTSVALSNNINSIMPAVSMKVKVKDATSPTTLSTYKNDISRRVLSLPNPEAFLRVVKLMSDNWSEIRSASESPNSLSPITYIHTYRDDESEMLNSENVRESIRSKSDFIEGIKNCIRASLGYKYRLDVDVANCYNTIYTHSIA